MHHKVFSSFYWFLLVSSCLFLFSDLSMHKLRVGSLNINGGRDRHKRALVSEVASQKGIDVLFLQETHTNQVDEVEWGLWWEGTYALSHGSTSSAGVAIMFRASAKAVILSTVEVVKGRLLIVKAEIKGVVLCFINLYGPNQGSERVGIFNLLNNELQNYHQEQLIFGGDFNCTLDFTVDRTSEEPHPQSARSLRNIIMQMDLLDAWRVKHPQARQYTWVRVSNNRVSAARLDRIYISKNLSSRLVQSGISPVGFTDHHLVSVDLIISPGERVKSYWFFNNKLLQDVHFCQSFEYFWQQWQIKKAEFSSLRVWWEVGKAQIRVFCQQYTSHSTAKVKAAVQDLEVTIKNIEEGLQRDSDPTMGNLLREKKLELSSFLQERVKGALVRARFLQLKDMDAPTSFFFNLERSVAQRKQMTCLKLPGGRVTTNPGEMRSHAMNFYADLFRAEPCSMECREDLLEGLPQLSSAEKASLDRELSLEELTDAVNQMSSGRAPGIDGLSTDFFKRFWIIIGPDLHAVFLECIKAGALPVSCKIAVLFPAA